MEVLKFIGKLILCAVFVIALDLIIPFSSSAGINYITANGKWLLWLIGAANVFIGGALSGGFFDGNLTNGFRYWFQGPFNSKGDINPTYGFGALALIINALVILALE